MIKLPVYHRDEGLYVFSRELHRKLEVSVPHDEWITGFFKKHQMGIGYDYDVSPIIDNLGYILYIDTAQSMALCERTKLGIKVRRYLIWFKKEYDKRVLRILSELNHI